MMRRCTPQDVGRWTNRAEDMRAFAETASTAETKAGFEQCAEGYESMVRTGQRLLQAHSVLEELNRGGQS